MAVADMVHGIAVEIHEPAARRVLDPDAFGLGNCAEAGRGQRLVQERIGIPSKKVSRFVLRFARGPIGPRGAGVGFAFGVPHPGQGRE